VCSLVSGGR